MTCDQCGKTFGEVTGFQLCTDCVIAGDAERDTIRKQRDELLAAHRRINEAVPPHDTSWLAHDWAAYIIKLQAISSAAIAACEDKNAATSEQVRTSLFRIVWDGEEMGDYEA